ncbi:MAG TPA: PilT/PilU family type 4a pilus ATPase [Verrucomicrobiae bacterium]|nr:PilT/PilU family type 4a pilus ATPase [Verrucomicrobiae bacterium]
MNLSTIISAAKERRASDIHLEAGLPVALRITTALQIAGEPLSAETVGLIARQVIGEEAWPEFLLRGSADLSRTIEGVRCRINVMQTARGPGLAIRLLSSFQATIERLNLHPDLKKLIAHPHGLILVSGPTGSGKSSTLAALIQEINLSEARHIITLEQPIEYQFRPVKSFIRQREIGRDSPSFEQGLLDAMREDPDVLMVGEMRDPETMRLTLNASETGHLVFATIHSSTAIEALQRLVSAFPSEIQNSISAQLADCLAAVVCQRLRYEERLGIRLPECEILMPTHAVKNFVRRGDFFQIASVMETGAESGMWTFTRYRTWMANRRDWSVPSKEAADLPADDRSGTSIGQLPRTNPTARTVEPKPGPAGKKAANSSGGRIEIEPDEGEFGKILKREP